MKKLMIAVLLMTGLASFAQEQKPIEKKQPMERLTPEQRNDLRLKKLTLELNLNNAQQKEMSKLIAEQSAKRDAARAERKAKMEKADKSSADERYALQSKMLDEKIAYKEKVRKILTLEQFQKWEKTSDRKYAKMKEHSGKRKAMRGERK